MIIVQKDRRNGQFTTEYKQSTFLMGLIAFTNWLHPEDKENWKLSEEFPEEIAQQWRFPGRNSPTVESSDVATVTVVSVENHCTRF